MKIAWSRADIAPKINHDGRGLIYACAAALCWTKRSYIIRAVVLERFHIVTHNYAPSFAVKMRFYQIKDTYIEKAASNKTPALTKSANMGIWVVGTSNQLFTRGS